MATATAPAPVEVIAPATAKEEKSKRPRPNVNYPPIAYNTEDEAKGKHPRIAPVSTATDKDGKVTETIETAKAVDAEGYRLVRVTHTATNKDKYVWARTTDMGLASVASAEYKAEFTDAKKRGRAKSIDPIYVTFAKMMKASGDTKGLAQFLTEYPEYAAHLE
jgi:hypothetical protein